MNTTQEAQPANVSTTTLADDRRLLLSKLGLMHEVDVCTLCNVKSETLWTWRRENRGPAYVKLGREICYRVDDLMAWISSNVVTFMGAPSPLPAAANDTAPDKASAVA